MVNLIFNLIAMVIEAFGAFNHLEKHLSCLFGLLYDFWGVFVMFCLRGCSTLGSTYTVALGYLGIHTPLLLCDGTLPELICLDLQMLRLTISSGQLEPNYSSFKLCCR